jgi:hypothetical protein
VNQLNKVGNLEGDKMNKILYFVANGIAVIICIFLIVLGAIIVKLLGVVGLFFIIREFVTGKYKKYIA